MYLSFGREMLLLKSSSRLQCWIMISSSTLKSVPSFVNSCIADHSSVRLPGKTLILQTDDPIIDRPCYQHLQQVNYGFVSISSFKAIRHLQSEDCGRNPLKVTLWMTRECIELPLWWIFVTSFMFLIWPRS